MLSQKQDFLTVLSLVFFGVLYSLAIFDLTHREGRTVELYLPVNQQVVDSVFYAQTVEQQVANLFFALEAKANDSVFYGGTRSGQAANNLQINFSFSENFIDQAGNEPQFPPLEGIFALNDSLFSQIVDFSAAVSTPLIFADYLRILDTNVFSDTNVIKKYLAKFYRINEIFLSHGKIVAPKFRMFAFRDTTFKRNFDTFYSKLLAQIPVILTDSLKFADTLIKKYHYPGLIVWQKNDSTAPDDFVKSNADVILCDTAKNLYNKFLELLALKSNYKFAVEKKSKKVLILALWLSANRKPVRPTDSLLFERLKYAACENSVVLLKNDTNALPLISLTRPFLAYEFSDKPLLRFRKNTGFYKAMIFKHLDSLDSKKLFLAAGYTIIFAIDKKISLKDSIFLKKLQKIDTKNLLVLVNFGHKENLKFLTSFKTVIYVPCGCRLCQDYAAYGIFGGIELKGIYPFNSPFDYGTSVRTVKTRIRPGKPVEAGLNGKVLSKIDSIANDAIKRGAFPGCQVFVVKNGIAVWNKTYGYFTYDRRHRVRKTDLYDIASVTKIVATTLATMKIYEMRKIALDKPLKHYFKDTHIEYTHIKPDTTIRTDTLNTNEFKTEEDLLKAINNRDTVHLSDTEIVCFDTLIYQITPKTNIFTVTVRQLLMHKSGIQPSLPILKFLDLKLYYDLFVKWQLIDTQKVSLHDFYFTVYSDRYIKDSAEYEIAKNMFLRNRFYDTLWSDTKQLPVAKKKYYVYSDVNMILLKRTIDTILGYPAEKFLSKVFYKPLGLNTIGYKPLERFDKKRIAPTEKDKYWRHQLLQGYVHDPSAALLGGISGNAGIFSDAKDLAVIGQMLLNKGTYGGIRYLKKSTVDTFTTRQHNSHRGLGFDMWKKNYKVAPSASKNTFGHLGFTGTCLWIDPDNEIVYVFLSNRVYPSAKNWKINRLKIREKIHEVVYEAFIRQ